MPRLSPILTLLFSLLFTLDTAAQTVHYVDADAAGAADGTSWTNAFTDLQDALAAASAGDEVWVAAGTYRPGTAGDRAATFALATGVRLYGGFAGTERRRTERDPAARVTLLSGDLAGDDDEGGTADNSYHVVTARGVGQTTILDGFTVTAGRADGAGDDALGGGLFIDGDGPTVSNTIVVGNEAERGGGIYVRGGTANLTNVLVNGNRATYGGGVYNEESDPVLTNVTVTANEAAVGGGVYNEESDPEIVNSLLWGNTATEGGDGLDAPRLLVPAHGTASLDTVVTLTWSSVTEAETYEVQLARTDAFTAPLADATVEDTAYTAEDLAHETDYFWRVRAANTEATSGWSAVWSFTTKPAGDPNAALDCEREGYPCALADVDLDVLARSDSLGDEVVRMLREGRTVQEARAWIETQEGVVDVMSDTTALRYRLAGGRPFWVLSDAALATETNFAPGLIERNAGNRAAKIPAEPAADTREDVVGDDPEKKRALVLAPYHYDFTGEGAAVTAILSGTRGYKKQGSVTFLSNDTKSDQKVGIDAFTNWSNYDVVHVSTHGSHTCEDGKCRTTVSTGYCVDDVMVFGSKDGMGVGEDGLGVGVIKVEDDDRSCLSLSSDFFKANYPSALTDQIVFISACESAEGRDLAYRLLTDHTAGYFGWTQSVQAGAAKAAAIAFYRLASEEGLHARSAKNEMGKSGLTINDRVDDDTGERIVAKLVYGGGYLHIREIIWALHPITEKKLPTEAAYPVLGEPEDGEPDPLPYVVEVDGVENKPERFTVHAEADGFSAEPKLLSQGEAVDGEGNVWRLRGAIQLPYDTQQGQELDLKVWIEMPGDGLSEHEETITIGNPELYFRSVIDSYASDSHVRSEVKAEFRLRMDDDAEFFYGEDDLDHVDFLITEPNCSFDADPVSGTLVVKEAVFPFQEGSSSGYGLPTRFVLRPLDDIYTTVTPECDGHSVPPTNLPHWYSGFVSFRVLDGSFDESIPGALIEDWEVGTGEVLARKVYESFLPQDDGQTTEKTTIELRAPKE